MRREGAAVTGRSRMYHLLILFHIVLFSYWLGTDIGVFYASRFVLRPDLGPQARSVALKIMSVLDMGPRVCLILFLPSGVSLVAASPYARGMFGGWKLALVWLLALAWLALAIAGSRGQSARLGPLVRRADLAVRWLLVLGLLGVAGYTLAAAHPFGVTSNPTWLGLKVGCYGLAIACGIGIRARLKPFGPAFASLMTTGSAPDVERVLRRSIGRSIPFVIAIWTLVLAAAALGVFKPGAHLAS